MKRRLLTLLAAALALAACADPAARITADQAAASQDGGGTIGSGTRTEEEDPCRGYFGSGNTVPENCPTEGETPP